MRNRKKPKIFITNNRMMIKCYGLTIGEKVVSFLWKNNYTWPNNPQTKQDALSVFRSAFRDYGTLLLEVTSSGFIYYQAARWTSPEDLTPIVLSGTKFLKMMKEDSL